MTTRYLSQEKNVPIGLDNKYLYNNVMRMHIKSYYSHFHRPMMIILRLLHTKDLTGDMIMDDVSENSMNDPLAYF